MYKLILLGLAGLSLSCRSGNHFAEGEPLPSFKMLSVDGSILKSDQIDTGRFTVFMYFRTDCVHCQNETDEIVKAGESLKDINIIFLTPDSLKILKQYFLFFGLGKYSNFWVATDEKKDFAKYFKPTKVPFMAIYNRENRFYGTYIGAVPIDFLRSLNRIGL